MPEQIISASGTQYGLVINPDGSINVNDANFTGSFYNLEVPPIAPILNNPQYQFIYMISGTATGITGSEIGSIVQFIDTGSYVSVFTYLNNNLISVGSWV